MTDRPLVRLKYLAMITMGQSPPSSAYVLANEALPFLQGNAEFGACHPHPVYGCDAAPKRCQQDDLLLSVRAPVGAINIADQIYGIGRGLCAVSASPKVDPHFLRYAAVLVADQLKAVAVGSTYDAVAIEKVANARIPLCPLEVQREIVDFLNQETAIIDELMRRKRRLLLLLGERRLAIVRAAVTGELLDDGRLADADLPWLDRIRAGWLTAKLTHVARLGTGHTPDRRRSDFWARCTIPWITTGDVEQFRDDRREIVDETSERISELGLANSSAVLHPAGTVVLSRTASVGFSAIMGRDMATSQDFATWTCSAELEPRFLLLCLRAMRDDLVGRLAMGSTHKTIYMPDIEAIRIPLPPIAEQRAVVDVCSGEQTKIDELSRLIEKQLPLLSERRLALVTAAVTGEIDPASHNGKAVAA